MFSPAYARARARGRADPLQYVAINVALTGRRSGWAFVEGPIEPEALSAGRFALGDSVVTRRADGGIELDFRGPRTAFDPALSGRFVLRPRAPGGHIVSQPRPLDALGRHWWWPMLPSAQVEAEFDRPHVRFSGRAYFDGNVGDEPLAAGFRRWHWMRVLREWGTQVAYAAEPAAGRAAQPSLAICYGDDGSERTVPLPAARPLAASRWRVPRVAFGEAKLLSTVLDAPFYARSRLLVDGRDLAMHESLDLMRWQRRWSQFLLRFRMRSLPRASL